LQIRIKVLPTRDPGSKQHWGALQKSDVRALTKGMLFQQIIVTDGTALVSPYLFSTNTGYSPRLEISDSCPVFGAFLRELDELWNANSSN
jgi:hypothetical protein